MKNFEDEAIDDMDLLGDLELNELDNLVSFADNIATKLALNTQSKLKKMGAKVKTMSQNSKSKV